jgi:hypothetical protein
LAELLAPLGPEQIMLLRTMAEPYLSSGEWPVWQYVVNKLESDNLDAEKLIRSLPRVGSRDLAGLSYGAAWPVQYHIAPDSHPGLTVAAASHLPDLVSVMAQPFMNVLRVLTQMQLNAPESPHEVKQVTVTPDDIKHALPSISDTVMIRLPVMLEHEPPTFGGGSWTGADGNWTKEVRREVLKYRNVRDLRGYIERVTALLPTPESPAELLRPAYSAVSWTGQWQGGGSEPVVNTAARRQAYVDESLISELEARSDTARWKLDKLTGLLRELNSNFADEHPYACHALLRAILDHVPPIFQLLNFDQVANNHRWPTPADKTYIANLNGFRVQGHDVLHRQISTRANLIDMSDVPPPIWLNTMVRCCIDLL